MATSSEQQAQEAARHPLVEKLGSFGFMAQGLLYLVVAAIAGSVGFGTGGEASQTGAISELSEQAYGNVLLVVLALGLAAYSALRMLHVVINPSGEDGLQGLVMRASYAVRALVYGGLTVFTVRELFGSSSSGGSESRLTQVLLDLPGGRVIVALIAVSMLLLGGYQLWSAFTRQFMDHLEGATARQQHLTRIVGTTGYAARGVVFGTVGVLFAQAALQQDSSEAGGVDKALQTIASSPAGTVALFIIALGLACFGLYCFALGSWGRMRQAG